MKEWINRIVVALVVQSTMASAALESNFENPPSECSPGVFWYWLNGRVTSEGIDADLESMKAAGIEHVMLFNIAHLFTKPSTALQPVKVLSPEWRKLMKQALKKADALGMTVNLYNSMEGWSSTGGPGITPELAMQRITWSELKLDGGKRFNGPLPMPRFGFDTYREIAVLAFPTPASELAEPVPVITSNVPGFDSDKLSKDPIPSIGFSSYCYDFKQTRADLAMLPATKGKERYITLTYEKPFAARSFRLYPAYRTPWIADKLATGELQRSDDGDKWHSVKTFTLKGYTPIDISFAAEPARYWRVVLSGERDLPLDELKLSESYRIENWTTKSFFSFRHLAEVSAIELAEHPVPASEIIKKESIINLSSSMNGDGELDWEVPPGNWTVLRFGYTPTGSEVRPAGCGAEGLENDKFSRESLDAHWAQAIQPWLDDPETRDLFDTVHIDSFEAGSQNWTPRMPGEFRNRNGYDMTPYLPVMIGRVVGSELESERFLWDFRSTACDLVTENYFEHFRDLCHAAGKAFSIEPYGDNGILNNVAAAEASDLPMAEHKHYYGTKLASSPAHLYEKPVVSVEAFTVTSTTPGTDWSTAFWDLKIWADTFSAGGVNHFGYHVFNAQPYGDDVKPGLTLGRAGTHFNRGHTWWPEMPTFSTYLARSSYLLQQGRFVGDVLFVFGEGAPKNFMYNHIHSDPVYRLPKQYDCDIGDLDVLLNRITVKDGMLTTPDGIAYRILVVPNESDAMTPQLVKRIGELVEAGATVMAPKPLLSPSLRAQPGADAYIKKAADAIWGNCDGVQAKEHSHGKGKVVWGRTLAQTLEDLDIEPALTSPVISGHQSDLDGWRWIQRRLPEGDLYFVVNGTDRGGIHEFSFRTEGTSPQWFDAVTGKTRMLPEYRKADGRVSLNLEFAPRQSGFILFSSQKKPAMGKNNPQLRTVQILEGAWEVSFDPKWGGPAKTTFPALTDWSKNDNEGIRYYSGRATYTKSFDWKPNTENRTLKTGIWLDLGTVKNLANVTLDGKTLGTVWCAPWHIEIEPKPGRNVIEIEVVNLWVNRLIGDIRFDPDGVDRTPGGMARQLPAWLDGSVPRSEKRYTFALYNPWKADSPLQPSGLLGPVSIKATEE